ncbi:serine hydrolase domain-containing protein [Sphaerisporangium corydalis]|uniref:Serine hydrolase domain-containing protein n=1 Tax=Sphaerisporangium corydalis TaxID=1441875 RepID=A0ABV9EJP1_9ACTN|nr:serine hydrolase domain-containing protein [Sphaerisporangium corydalis]
MTEAQKRVQTAIEELVESGAETGVQVAVYLRGELVVDAVAGVADSATGRPLTSGTPIYSTSTGKGVTAAVVHVLAERGVLDYDTPIAELWPEFGAHGKQAATLRHALTHSIGIPGVPVDTTPEDLCDWDKMCAALAAAEPWWEPGTKTGYHPQSFGYIIGEVVRRATGERISQVLREEIAVPLGVADELYFGVPATDLGRLARLEEAGPSMEMPPEMLLEIPFFRVVNGYTAAPMAAMPDAAFGNRADVLSSDIPAGGTFSARAVARVYAALLGEVNGVRLISPERLREVTAVSMTGMDEIAGMPATLGLGYNLSPSPHHTSNASAMSGTSSAVGASGTSGTSSKSVRSAASGTSGDPTRFGMSGSGGSTAWADTATGLAFALTKNLVSPGVFTTADHITEIVITSLSDH